MSNSVAIDFSSSATCRTISLFSITHGPAIKEFHNLVLNSSNNQIVHPNHTISSFSTQEAHKLSLSLYSINLRASIACF